MVEEGQQQGGTEFLGQGLSARSPSSLDFLQSENAHEDKDE
jgi:hypothetical protein